LRACFNRFLGSARNDTDISATEKKRGENGLMGATGLWPERVEQ